MDWKNDVIDLLIWSIEGLESSIYGYEHMYSAVSGRLVAFVRYFCDFVSIVCVCVCSCLRHKKKKKDKSPIKHCGMIIE